MPGLLEIAFCTPLLMFVLVKLIRKVSHVKYATLRGG